MQMYSTLTDPSRPVILPGDPDFETAVEAERDMQVLAFVLDVAAANSADQKFRDLLKFALGDSVLPQGNRDHSKGRDFQFELFVAAICQNAYLVPVEREEPDVTCLLQGIKYGIAAKRVKSAGNLRKRVSKAASQIQRAGYPGIIALDTCLLFNPDNVRITSPIPDHEYGRLHKQALDRCIRKYHDGIQEWVRGKCVCGLVFHDQQVRRLDVNGNWSLEGMTVALPVANLDEPHRREFSCFTESYFKGLPNLQ